MEEKIATIESPQFIELKQNDISPFISECQIKVMYIGQNRNRSFITKEVATEMSKSLRGNPIVGYYKEDKQDFHDHGHSMTIDDEGVHFDCKTFPYGFVAPDAKVWFQIFEEEDEFGNTCVREYLVTNGYLWTGQYPECQCALEGRPQSMELDDETLEGHWATDNNKNIDFFIINDAKFSKLCILGEDVEPCFEGANVKQKNNTFSLENNFNKTLFSMMEELKNYRQEGGQQEMEDKNKNLEPEVNPDFAKDDDEKKKKEQEDKENKEGSTKEKGSEKQPENTEDKDKQAENKDSDTKEKENSEEDKDKKKKKFELEEQYETLKNEYSALEEKYNSLNDMCQELVAFKQNIENKEKDELIDKFTMLSEEEKADVIENKTKYSYDEIENKLSVMYTRHSLEAEKAEEKGQPQMTFSRVNNEELGSEDSLLNFLKSVRDNK